MAVKIAAKIGIEKRQHRSELLGKESRLYVRQQPTPISFTEVTKMIGRAMVWHFSEWEPSCWKLVRFRKLLIGHTEHLLSTMLFSAFEKSQLRRKPPSKRFHLRAFSTALFNSLSPKGLSKSA